MINLRNTHRPQTEPSPASDVTASAHSLVKNYGASATAARTPPGRGREIVGRFLVWTSGIHVGVAAADPSIYRHFADAAGMDWVERGWNGVFMANPRAWGLAVAAGELTLALLLLHGGRAAKVGWLGVIGFQVALVLFGWGYLIWSAPALAVLVPLVWREWPRLSAREPVSVEPAS